MPIRLANKREKLYNSILHSRGAHAVADLAHFGAQQHHLQQTLQVDLRRLRQPDGGSHETNGTKMYRHLFTAG